MSQEAGLGRTCLERLSELRLDTVDLGLQAVDLTLDGGLRGQLAIHKLLTRLLYVRRRICVCRSSGKRWISGLDGQVRFLGHRDDIVDVLQAMNVLVMCSDHEGLPMVLLEALWLGVPIVGRGVGGIREILGDNECGLCVDSSQAADFAEACEQLLNHPALRERLLSAAKERINSEFTVERSAESIVQLYRQLSGK